MSVYRKPPRLEIRHRLAHHARLSQLRIADLTRGINLLAGEADVGKRRSEIFVVNLTFLKVAVTLNLTPLLRGVVTQKFPLIHRHHSPLSLYSV
jgi:hypothetical protein